jgi:hypothetical protein
MARKAKRKQSPDILQILKKLEQDTARDVKKRLGGTWRDNLFEILMTRFELARPHKKLFSALFTSREMPKLAPRLLKDFYGTMDRMLDLAGIPSSSCRPVVVTGFGALYLSLVPVWLEDDSKDLAKTMAAVDRRLGLFEQGMEFCEGFS